MKNLKHIRKLKNRLGFHGPKQISDLAKHSSICSWLKSEKIKIEAAIAYNDNEIKKWEQDMKDHPEKYIDSPENNP